MIWPIKNAANSPFRKKFFYITWPCTFELFSKFFLHPFKKEEQYSDSENFELPSHFLLSFALVKVFAALQKQEREQYQEISENIQNRNIEKY